MTNLLYVIRKQGWRRFAQQAWAKNSIYFYSTREHADVCIWIVPKTEFQTIESRQDMEFYSTGNWVTSLSSWTKTTNQPTNHVFLYVSLYFLVFCVCSILFLMWFYSFVQMVSMYADLIFLVHWNLQVAIGRKLSEWEKPNFSPTIVIPIHEYLKVHTQ